MPPLRSSSPTRSASYSTTSMDLRKSLFRTVARLNKALLPKLWSKDLIRLTPLQKALVAYRYWVTRNAL